MSKQPEPPPGEIPTTQTPPRRELADVEQSAKGESPKGQNRFVVSLRNIVLWVTIAASVSGFNVGRVVDDIWPDTQPRPVAEKTVPADSRKGESKPGDSRPARARVGRSMLDDLKAVVDDVGDGRISLDEATDELFEIFKEVVPTNDEIKAQIKRILEKAQQQGTRRAWNAAANELATLLSSLIQPSATPSPTPATSQGR